MFSQAEMADERNYYKPKSGSHGAHVSDTTRDWSAGMAVYRHFQADGAAPDRLHAGRGRGASSHLVRRRTLGLRLGDDRRLFRLYSRHHRHAGSRPSRRSSAAIGCPGMNLAAGETANWPLETRALRPPPCGRRRGHRLLRLARRLSGERRCLRQGQSEAHRPSRLVAAVRRRHAQLPAACRTAIC